MKTLLIASLLSVTMTAQAQSASTGSRAVMTKFVTSAKARLVCTVYGDKVVKRVDQIAADGSFKIGAEIIGRRTMIALNGDEFNSVAQAKDGAMSIRTEPVKGDPIREVGYSYDAQGKGSEVVLWQDGAVTLENTSLYAKLLMIVLQQNCI